MSSEVTTLNMIKPAAIATGYILLYNKIFFTGDETENKLGF